MARINPAGLAQLQVRLTPAALRGAQAAADKLHEKLSGEGSGVKYSGLPRRSSAEGEYPAEQKGDLLRSIKARPDPKRPGFAEWGSIDGPAFVTALHFKAPDAGGRPFMDDALQDRDIHQAVLDAVRGHE